MKISELEEKWSGSTPGIMGTAARFGVLIPLVEKDGRAHILFEVRSGNVTQPGEVCFPGGYMEPGEDEVACALRETEEELGIPRSAIRPIAQLDTMAAARGVICPLLAQVESGAAEHLTLNPDEVAETFLVPVDFFLETAPRVYRFTLRPLLGRQKQTFFRDIGFPEGYKMKLGRDIQPVWHYENHIIWGLTAKILLWNFRREDWFRKD